MRQELLKLCLLQPFPFPNAPNSSRESVEWFNWALKKHKHNNFRPVAALSLVVFTWSGIFPSKRHLFSIKVLMTCWGKDSLLEKSKFCQKIKSIVPGSVEVSRDSTYCHVIHMSCHTRHTYVIHTPFSSLNKAAVQKRWIPGGGLETTRICLSLYRNGSGIPFFSN